MQLDFKYELRDFIVKCKYRDTIISNKVSFNCTQSIYSKLKGIMSSCTGINTTHCNYYSDTLRFFSFGFLKKIHDIGKYLLIMPIILQICRAYFIKL